MPSVKVLAIPRAAALILNLAVLIAWIYYEASAYSRFSAFICLASGLGLIINIIELQALIKYRRSWQAYEKALVDLQAKQRRPSWQGEFYGTEVPQQTAPTRLKTPLFWTKWRTFCVSADSGAVLFQIIGLAVSINMLCMLIRARHVYKFEGGARHIYRRIFRGLIVLIALSGAALVCHLALMMIYCCFNRRLNKRGQQEERELAPVAEHEQADMRFRATAVAYTI